MTRPRIAPVHSQASGGISHADDSSRSSFDAFPREGSNPRRCETDAVGTTGGSVTISELTFFWQDAAKRNGRWPSSGEKFVREPSPGDPTPSRYEYRLPDMLWFALFEDRIAFYESQDMARFGGEGGGGKAGD